MPTMKRGGISGDGKPPTQPPPKPPDVGTKSINISQVLHEIETEIGVQDHRHPAGYPATRDGVLLGLAAMEDEWTEAYAAWREERSEPHWASVYEELKQVAAVAARLMRSIKEIPMPPRTPFDRWEVEYRGLGCWTATHVRELPPLPGSDDLSDTMPPMELVGRTFPWTMSAFTRKGLTRRMRRYEKRNGWREAKCNCDPGEPPDPGEHSTDCPAYGLPHPSEGFRTERET